MLNVTSNGTPTVMVAGRLSVVTRCVKQESQGPGRLALPTIESVPVEIVAPERSKATRVESPSPLTTVVSSEATYTGVVVDWNRYE